MTNVNVIDNSASGNYRALTPSSNYHDHYSGNFVGESEPDYPYDNSNTSGVISSAHTSSPEPTTNNGFDAPPAQPLWPQFPDGAYLNARQTEAFYRAAQGISGLVFVLNRSAHQRGLARDYQGEPDDSLSEVQESKVWNALIKLSADLNNLADDLLSSAEENTRQ